MRRRSTYQPTMSEQVGVIIVLSAAAVLLCCATLALIFAWGAQW